MPDNPRDFIVKALGSLPYLRFGRPNSHVRLLQQELESRGYMTQKEVTGEFDTATRMAVEEFQLDYRLKVDGIVGPQTWSALAGDLLAAPVPEEEYLQGITWKTIRLMIATAALALLGLDIKEQGANRGWAVDLIQRHAAGSVGWAWCAAFCDYVVDKAYEVATNFAKPYDVWISCSEIYRRAKARGLVRDEPRVGDLVLFRGGKTGFKHVGVCIGMRAGAVVTIEGNTNDDGDPEGDGVYKRLRDPQVTSMVYVSCTD